MGCKSNRKLTLKLHKALPVFQRLQIYGLNLQLFCWWLDSYICKWLWLQFHLCITLCCKFSFRFDIFITTWFLIQWEGSIKLFEISKINKYNALGCDLKKGS